MKKVSFMMKLLLQTCNVLIFTIIIFLHQESNSVVEARQVDSTVLITRTRNPLRGKVSKTSSNFSLFLSVTSLSLSM